MSSTQQVTGISSGFDTASIVEGLMKIEKMPYDKLDVKKQTQELKLQAYQAVNSMFLKFKTSIGTLSTQKTWRAKSTNSTNENSLKATANEYAVNGTYSFKVAQMATAAQYMSKGFASSKTAIVKQQEGETAYKVGEITLNSAKARVDTSAKVDSLNGGKGMYRGQVRITDASGRSSVIDLSTCDTMDDVVRTLNGSTGAQVTASIKEGKLHIQDESQGTGALKIQNVGSGTTATDLGIAGSAANGENFIHGRNVYTLGNEMSLSTLQDGLGVEEGYMYLMVSKGSEYYEVKVNVDDCSTVGDILKRVNNEIDFRVQNGVSSATGASASMLEGLRLTLSEDKTSFALAGTQAGSVYQFYDEYDPNRAAKQTPAAQLGLTGLKLSATEDNQVVTFNRCIGAVDSPMLNNLAGVNGNGVGTAGGSSKQSVRFTENTKVSDLNGGAGVDHSMPMQIVVKEGGESVTMDPNSRSVFSDILDPTELNALMNNKDTTISELTEFLNDSLRKYANDPSKNAAVLAGMSFQIDVDNARMVIVGAQGAHEIEIYGTLANSLGLYRVGDSAMKNPQSTQAQKDQQNAINDFYQVDDEWISGNGEYDVILLEEKKETIKAEEEGEEDQVITHGPTTLGQLDSLLGLPEGASAADVEQRLQDLLDGDFKLTIQTSGAWVRDDIINGEKVSVYSPQSSPDIVIDLSDIKDQFSGDLSNVSVKDLMEAINSEIKTQTQDQVDDIIAAAPAGQLDGFQISSPQLRVDPTGKGLQWSNVDVTRKLTVSGTIADELGLTGSIGPDVVSNQSPNIMGGFNFNPVATGYVKDIPIDGSVELGYLNNGSSLTFAGEETDTLTIDLGDGKSIDITMKELRDALNGSANGGIDVTGIDPSQQNSLNTTMDDYAAILTALAKEKIDALGLGVTDTPAITFGVGSSGLTVSGITNADHLKISGTAADAAKTGLGTISLDKVEDGKTYKLATLKAGEVVIEDVDGLGSVTLTLGNGNDVTLTTGTVYKTNAGGQYLDKDGNVIGDDEVDKRVVVEKGIDGYSTLNDLIARLNSELDKAAVSEGDDSYKDVRFVINDSGTGIALSNTSNKEVNIKWEESADTLAKDLGLVDAENKGVKVEAFSHFNAKSVGRQYVSRATSLADVMGGPNVPNGSIKLTNAAGVSTVLDLTDCKTVGDVIDFINQNPAFGIYAELNEMGDGITIGEAYPYWDIPDPLPTGNISIADVDGGSIAKKLGIAGTGSRDNNPIGASIFYGSQKSTIDVMSSDTLESLMYRISEKGYKTAVVNDGSTSNPYRLTITAPNTGEAGDFVIESDLDIFGFSQRARGTDAKVLYGAPNSSSSPIMLSSSTNSNSNAILGLTLDIKAPSNEWTTITVDTDKEKVVEEIKNMVQTYNDLNDLVSYLDAYDEETGEPGVLFGDSSIRKLMEDINDMFYLVFNPNNLSYYDVESQATAKGQQTYTWMDLGVSLSAKNTSSDGTGNWYSSMDLDLDALDEMVSKNWDTLYNVLAGQRNASDTRLDETVRPAGYFNGKVADGFNADNAINGNINTADWGANNGMMADGTIAEGQDEYTIYFQKTTTVSRMSIYHYDMDTALKNFTVEYLDANTGKWEILRDIKNNGVEANHLGMPVPTEVQAIRIKASSTNAEDGKFRLLDVQIFEDTGLAGQLNHLTTALGDTSSGWLYERNNEITDSINDITEQMERLAERLDLKEQSLWNKFNAMESALGQLQNQSNYFTSMIDSMSTSKKK